MIHRDLLMNLLSSRILRNSMFGISLRSNCWLLSSHFCDGRGLVFLVLRSNCFVILVIMNGCVLIHFGGLFGWTLAGIGLIFLRFCWSRHWTNQVNLLICRTCLGRCCFIIIILLYATYLLLVNAIMTIYFFNLYSRV
jgi:hypothetical protein